MRRQTAEEREYPPSRRRSGRLRIWAGLCTGLILGALVFYVGWPMLHARVFASPQVEMSPSAHPSTTPILNLPDLSGSLASSDSGTGVTSLAARHSSARRIIIPAIQVDQSIVEVGWSQKTVNDQLMSVWDVAEYAVGHHKSTANPGEVGNIVLSGHDDWKGEVFKDLEKLKNGDRITLKTGDSEYLYIVTSMTKVPAKGVPREVQEANAAYLNPTSEETLTLVTCWPYNVDDHRLVIVARPYQAGTIMDSSFQPR